MIVLFGAGGQLGRELTAAAAHDGVPLTAVPHEQADITDSVAVERVLGAASPSLVINAAAYNQVDKAEAEPDEAMRINAIGPGIVAAACAGADVPMVHISTDYVFDGAKPGPYVEDDPIAPLSVYGCSKAEGEAAVRGACPRHIIVRTAWLFSRHGSNFVKTMLRLAAERDALTVVADQRGSPTSAVDLARAVLIAAAALADGSDSWGTYHFAGSGETTRHGLASRIVAVQALYTGRLPMVHAVATADRPTPARRPLNSVLDSSKFAATFGFRAADWRDAVDRTVTGLMDRASA